ncbi:hypothetical protein CPB84DRAFT_1965045 [Gymnopilus junonius]|uniref:Uncharacterized protein n=1 Tax=Gymnopilus junonius TaxID=109634 RepID=A0A9P5NFA3_GYMJU|nr:hypothetical protein CPB84DRAFT_1965045 [Gymnopilus junonius]
MSARATCFDSPFPVFSPFFPAHRLARCRAKAPPKGPRALLGSQQSSVIGALILHIVLATACCESQFRTASPQPPPRPALSLLQILSTAGSARHSNGPEKSSRKQSTTSAWSKTSQWPRRTTLKFRRS